MTPEQLQELIDLGHEQYSVEFKGPGSRGQPHVLARVLKAMMAMANRRDGGVIVIGVDESSSGLMPTGLSAADASTWNRNHLGDSVAVHVEPPIEFSIERVHLGSKAFVVLRVAEFLDVPVICKKQIANQGEVLLKEGACFVRPRRKPESVHVPTYVDMRDLIDLATEKAVKRFKQLDLASAAVQGEANPTDAERFRLQSEELQ